MNTDRFRRIITTNLPIVKRAFKISWVYTRVVYQSDTDYHMATVGRFPIPIMTLYVDYSCRQFGRKAIIGLLAHEIAHYFTSNERRADEKALEAGYKANLIAFHKAHDELYDVFEEIEGMTLDEIKAWRKG